MTNTVSELIPNLANQVTFSPQIRPEQIKLIAEKGYKTIICNRPDNEEQGQPSIAEIQATCEELGLAFKDIPFSSSNLTQELVEEFAEYFNSVSQPVYMYCRSGKRSSLLYQASIQMNLLNK